MLKSFYIRASSPEPIDKNVDTNVNNLPTILVITFVELCAQL